MEDRERLRRVEKRPSGDELRYHELSGDKLLVHVVKHVVLSGEGWEDLLPVPVPRTTLPWDALAILDASNQLTDLMAALERRYPGEGLAVFEWELCRKQKEELANKLAARDLEDLRAFLRSEALDTRSAEQQRAAVEGWCRGRLRQRAWPVFRKAYEDGLLREFVRVLLRRDSTPDAPKTMATQIRRMRRECLSDLGDFLDRVHERAKDARETLRRALGDLGPRLERAYLDRGHRAMVDAALAPRHCSYSREGVPVSEAYIDDLGVAAILGAARRGELHQFTIFRPLAGREPAEKARVAKQFLTFAGAGAALSEAIGALRRSIEKPDVTNLEYVTRATWLEGE